MIRGKISQMLRGQENHISFHTPGHKRAGADITELSYSDNLFSPHGVIKDAEETIASALGSARTFFLTDGSTAGVHAMLYALRERGVKKIALSPYSHPSVTGGCKILGLECIFFPARLRAGMPKQPAREEMEDFLSKADALLLTSPDYYGFFPDLAFAKELCHRTGNPLVIDGAHGSHLHFDAVRYAGSYADMWVDGAHKSLSALTQGAAVSAKTSDWAEALEEGVRLFHTTSPSYPILASVEEAFLLPRNEKIEREAIALKARTGAVKNEDWTKLLYRYGENANGAQGYFEERGVYPEFNDGNYLMFYLSPCTKRNELKKLEALLKEIPPLEEDDKEELSAAEERSGEIEYLPLHEAIGRVCAVEAGIFPPSLPVIRKGEKVTEEAACRLENAAGSFGLKEGKIAVYTERK